MAWLPGGRRRIYIAPSEFASCRAAAPAAGERAAPCRAQREARRHGCATRHRSRRPRHGERRRGEGRVRGPARLPEESRPSR
eukprot:scaffold209798_cov30-Tisochrysis_lutea.AAC.3